MKGFWSRVRNIASRAETLHFPPRTWSLFKNERTSADWKVTCRIWNNVWYFRVFFGKVGSLLINGYARLALWLKRCVYYLDLKHPNILVDPGGKISFYYLILTWKLKLTENWLTNWKLINWLTNMLSSVQIFRIELRKTFPEGVFC